MNSHDDEAGLGDDHSGLRVLTRGRMDEKVRN
ncbi:hypothetical protein A2U01_0089284, partial [Trifolium medium]|nr:hypothetical protein [Trifolium medium]